jgi:hypothetical protein
MEVRMLSKFHTPICVFVLLAAVSTATAESPLNANATMHDNLVAAMATKKPVTVVLKNGQTYRAPLASVGDHLVILSGPAQKEYYDVLLVMDEIVAVEFRARGE